jgi:hypothetical protein
MKPLCIQCHIGFGRQTTDFFYRRLQLQSRIVSLFDVKYFKKISKY